MSTLYICYYAQTPETVGNSGLQGFLIIQQKYYFVECADPRAAKRGCPGQTCSSPGHEPRPATRPADLTFRTLAPEIAPRGYLIIVPRHTPPKTKGPFGENGINKQGGTKMKGVQYKHANCVLLGGKPDVYDLPICKFEYSDGQEAIESCWQMTFKERLRALFHGKIYFQCWGRTHPPVLLSTRAALDQKFKG